MTREEAIKALEEYGTLFPSDKIEAIDKAVEALQLDVVQCQDCEHWTRYNSTIFKGPAFAPCLISDGMNSFTAWHDYCSHGVRRADE